MGHNLRLDNDEQLLEQCRGQRVKEEPDRQGLFKKISFVKIPDVLKVMNLNHPGTATW